MKSGYLVETIRRAEEFEMARLPEGALMQKAATGLANETIRYLKNRRGKAVGARILVVAGSGNNGGDALWAASQLAARGVRVFTWRTSPRTHAEGWQACCRAGGREVDARTAIDLLPRLDAVIDGVLGIGGQGGLREPVATFAQACAACQTPVIAVDLPSGITADLPRQPAPASAHLLAPVSFQADLTVTFGGYKFCHLLESTRSACGQIRLVDIGLCLPEPDLTMWEVGDVAAHWPVPGPASHKYTRGVVGIQTGSEQYPGAGVLSATGAVYAGAGMVRVPAGIATFAISALPNVVLAAGRVQAQVLGSGWGARPDAGALLADAIASGLPLVIDADGLQQVGGLLGDKDRSEQILLTPHPGELASMLGWSRDDVETDPMAAVRRGAASHGATVLLKGASQYVATPAGDVTVAVPGPGWTGQAGSGDVLAGVCGALLAAGLAPKPAALAGASLQALTAVAHPGPYPPQVLAGWFPGIIAQLAQVRARLR